MNVVIPMAGRGSRFKEAGYALPKPLIQIRGKPMVKWATDSIPYADESFIFIVLKEHVDNFQLDRKLKEIYSDKIRIIVTDGITEGAACTVLLAEKLINNDDELIVYNADQYFMADIESALENLPEEVSGLIPVFSATNPRWSFAKADPEGYVVQVAEKVPISSNATVGLYYFRHGKDFVWAAKEMIRKDIRRNNEFYVCPVFNELIARGDKIQILAVDSMWGLGTPEDVEYFNKYYKEK
ncbi:glycosyltransferase family 2 protein [Candidatus Woesearchaeota archaeon]|nr:glycosyltransferase family 2 protein [Candidatus Woesearchaeota archaeon]